MGKLKQRAEELLVKDYKMSEWQNCDLNPSEMTSKFMFLTTNHYILHTKTLFPQWPTTQTLKQDDLFL